MKRRNLICLPLLILSLNAAAVWAVSTNTFLGAYAGDSLSGDLGDSFFGDFAGPDVTTGSNNAYAGQHSGMCTNGSYNTAIGEGSMAFPYGIGILCTSPVTGSYNTAVGYFAGSSISSGYYNVFLGYNAGLDNTTADYNTFVGSGAGASTATGGINTFIGYQAGFNNVGGQRNVYLGNKTGYNNVSGNYNIFIGDHAGENELGSSRLYIDSTLVGGTGTTTPLIYGEFDNNKLVINGSLIVTGSILTSSAAVSNTFLGASAGAGATGGNNTFIGNVAGYSNTTGYDNTYVGSGAGHNSNGNQNVFIGSMAGYYETGSDKLYIDNGYWSGSPLIYGEFSGNKIVKINGTLVMSSDERLKKNIEPLRSSLDEILKIRGVSYEWKDSAGDRGLGTPREIGFIAQEVEKVLPELVHTDSEGFKAVAYDKLAPVLVEALKEQQTIVSEERREIKEGYAMVGELTKEFEGQQEAIADNQRAISILKGRIGLENQMNAAVVISR